MFNVSPLIFLLKENLTSALVEFFSERKRSAGFVCQSQVFQLKNLNIFASAMFYSRYKTVNQDQIKTLIRLLNEKEVLLKDREKALEDQQEEFLSQKEELNAAVEELIAKNNYLTSALEMLRQRNHELDNILYRASHDLKTPVSSIYGLIGILRMGKLSDDQRQATTHLFEQIQQMEVRLSSLKDLSAAFFNKPHLQICSIQDIVYKTWQSIGLHRGIRLEFLTADLELRTDSSLLAIALKCLMHNSITYGDSSLPGYMRVSVTKKSNTIEIDVSDNGEKIDSEIEDRIFDMFYRGSERSKGFGLGLYIAKTIVEKLNGSVRYLSQAPENTFRLILPSRI